MVVAAQRYRYRFVHTNSDLIGLLPRTDGTLFFADISKLRTAGYLRYLAGSSPAQEKDYAEFLRETGFDWRNDIDALAGTIDARELLAVVRGRVHAGKIRQYEKAHGGDCASEVCSLPASTPGRWLSFVEVQPDVIALAVSADKTAAHQLQREGPSQTRVLSDAPVWLKPSPALLSNPAQLPVALRIFAIALQSADSAVVSLRSANDSGAAFEIEMNAWFPNQSAADSARAQLELNTKMLKLEFIREHKQAAPGDLASLLISGSFRSNAKELIASWPVQPELLQALE
jgi:hypothetical protein